MLSEPRWFGSSLRPLLGWYVAPAPGVQPRDAVVVLCPPFGYEAICTHRAYVELAQALAGAGFASLRFDFDGTGDSVGSDREPGRVEAWLASIEAAATEARALSGTAHVSLFGLRLGATLAAAAAATKVVASSLVLWAPLQTGRAYVRELKMLRQTAEGEYQATSPLVPTPLLEGDEESAGFFLAKETIEDLGRINLTKLARPPAPAILLLERDDLAEDKRLREALEAASAVTSLRVEGYRAVMQDPHKSLVPEQVFASLLTWLGERHPPMASPILAPVREPARVALIPAVPHMPGATAANAPSAAAATVREEVVTVAAEHHALEGVLCQPLQPPAGPRHVTVLLNAGGIRRIGPNRLYVAWARAWAADHGVATFRLDLGGIGDSEGATAMSDHLYNPSCVADVRAALGLLRSRFGFESFTLAGLCSGAYASFHTALVADNVKRVILINPQTFMFRPGQSFDVQRRKSATNTTYYRQVMFKGDAWKRVLKGDVDFKRVAGVIATRINVVARDRAKNLLARFGWKPASDVLTSFEGVLARGIDVQLIYSAGDPGLEYLDSYLGPGLRNLARPDAVKKEVIEGPDHTFTPLWSQVWLSDHLARRARTGGL